MVTEIQGLAMNGDFTPLLNFGGGGIATAFAAWLIARWFKYQERKNGNGVAQRLQSILEQHSSVMDKICYRLEAMTKDNDEHYRECREGFRRIEDKLS